MTISRENDNVFSVSFTFDPEHPDAPVWLTDVRLNREWFVTHMPTPSTQGWFKVFHEDAAESSRAEAELGRLVGDTEDCEDIRSAVQGYLYGVPLSDKPEVNCIVEAPACLLERTEESMREVRARIVRKIEVVRAARNCNENSRLWLAGQLKQGEAEGFAHRSEVSLLRDLLSCYRNEREFVLEHASLQLKLSHLERDALCTRVKSLDRIAYSYAERDFLDKRSRGDKRYLREYAEMLEEGAESLLAEIDKVRGAVELLPISERRVLLDEIAWLERQYTLSQYEQTFHRQKTQQFEKKRREERRRKDAERKKKRLEMKNDQQPPS